MDRLKEVFGQAAFALTGACWASVMISEARMARRFKAMTRAHIAAGGTVVTRQSRGMTAISLEG